MQQLRNDYSLTFPPLSIARYSFIQLSRLRHREVKENAQTSKRYQRGFEPGLSQLRVRHSTPEPPRSTCAGWDDLAVYAGWDNRCHGLRVYPVCVCNTVRLPGTGQSAHVIGGSRFTRPASNSRRTLLNWDCWPQFNKIPIFAPTSNL